MMETKWSEINETATQRQMAKPTDKSTATVLHSRTMAREMPCFHSDQVTPKTSELLQGPEANNANTDQEKVANQLQNLKTEHAESFASGIQDLSEVTESSHPGNKDIIMLTIYPL